MLRKLTVVAADAIYGHASMADDFAVLQIACAWMLLQYGCSPYKFGASLGIECFGWRFAPRSLHARVYNYDSDIREVVIHMTYGDENSNENCI